MSNKRVAVVAGWLVILCLIPAAASHLNAQARPADPAPRLPDLPYLGANAGKPNLGGKGMWDVKRIFDMAAKEPGIEEKQTVPFTPKGEAVYKERLENVRELATLAAKYDTFATEIGMEKFLEEAALMSDQDELTAEERGVKLMTVHASKGLEFEYVFVTGLEDGLFPHHSDENENLSPEDAEEERRLFYVAITRAKKKLFLSYARVRTIFGSRQVTIPSEFISEIDGEFTETEDFKGEYGARKSLFKIEF